MAKAKKKKEKVAKKAMKFEVRKEKVIRWVAGYDGTAYNGDILCIQKQGQRSGRAESNPWTVHRGSGQHRELNRPAPAP